MPGAAANQGTSRLAIRADRAFGGREMIPGGALVLCANGQIAGIEPGTAPAPDGWPVAEFPGATAGLALARQRGQKQARRGPARITAAPVSWFSACA